MFDADGHLLAQAAHIPVHLGAMPESVRAVAELAPFRPGDIAVLNDPFLGGTHLPDVTMVSPVFRGGKGNRLIGFVASRAHQADIGGMAPGSMPVARELIQEGLIIPPVRLYRAGALVPETLALILRNVRTPDERRGDLAAQVAAQRIGERRLAALADRLGLRAFERASQALLDYGERLAREALRGLPRGVYTFRDHLDDDGVNAGPVWIELPADDRVIGGLAPGLPRLGGPAGSLGQRRRGGHALGGVLRAALPLARRIADQRAGSSVRVRFTLPEGSVVNAACACRSGGRER